MRNEGGFLEDLVAKSFNHNISSCVNNQSQFRTSLTYFFLEIW